MGSTFSAVHVRGIKAKALAESFEAWVLEAGAYERLDDDAPESESDRRVLVFDDGKGWGVVADADFEFDLDAARDAARALSKTHATDAVLISVHHSDTALLERFSKGRTRGSVRVPEDAKGNRKTGHKEISASFLKDLAEDADDRRALDAPFLADRTFPEDTVLDVAQRAGLAAAGAGARYLWHEPPKGARKLRFAALEAEPVPMFDFRPPGAEGQAMSLHHQPSVEGCVGMPLGDFLNFTLQAHEGGRIEGLRVEFSGPAMASLAVERATGWNPQISNDGVPTEITESPLTREGERWIAIFPKGFVEGQGVPSMADMSPAAFRQWSQALATHHLRQFHFSLTSSVCAAGTSELRVKVTRLDGTPLPVAEGIVTIAARPAPRLPLLPASKKAVADDRLRVEARETYGSQASLIGWLAFDARWPELSERLLELTTTVSRLLVGKGELELSVTSAGTHPSVPKRFRKASHLTDKDFSVAVKHLAKEAQVNLHLPYDAMLQRMEPAGFVLLSHQPNGSTVFDPEMRRQLYASHPQPKLPPLELSFSLPAVTGPALQSLEALMEAAVSNPSCVGALLSPSGRMPHPGTLPWETLTGQHRFVENLELVREHVRAPGWLTLAPGASARRVEPNARVEVKQVPSGALLKSRAESPGAMTDEDRAAMERAVLPALAP